MSEVVERLRFRLEEARDVLLGASRRLAILGKPHFEIDGAIARIDETLASPPGEEAGWLPIESAPKDGTPFTAIVRWTMRWQPYKPTSEQYKRGLRGRWQQAGEYGGWHNAEHIPQHWEPATGAAAPQVQS